MSTEELYSICNFTSEKVHFTCLFSIYNVYFLLKVNQRGNNCVSEKLHIYSSSCFMDLFNHFPLPTFLSISLKHHCKMNYFTAIKASP